MFEILCRPRPSPAGEMFQEDIGDSVDESEQTLEPLHGEGATRFPGRRFCRDLEIPRPAEFRKATDAAEHGHDTEEEEDAAFDEMRQSVEEVDSFLEFCQRGLRFGRPGL